MKEKLENIKKMYCDLNNKLNSINEEIMNEEGTHDELTVRFKSDGCELDAIKSKFKESEEIINEMKKKYVFKKINTHINLVSLITFLVSIASCCFVASNGLVMGPFFAFGVSFGLSLAARMLEITLFWDKLKNKYEESFEELENTIKLREESDKLYVEKLKQEDKYSESQKNIVEHTTKLNALLREKHILETEINEIKLNTFDDVIQNQVDDELKLTLK